MIVKHTNTTPTDTDKLPDIDALITEKGEELRKICYDNNRQCAILVDAKGRRDGLFFFWKLKENPEATVDNEGKWDTYSQTKSFNNLINGINMFLGSLTNDQLGVGHVVPPPHE